MLIGLDIFSGIGGISYALREYVRPIAYCEIDTYCQAVLINQMDSGKIFRGPIWGNICTLNLFSGELPRDYIEIIYGGFPCQDISVAGHGKGLDGERSGLYWEVHRLAKEIKPKFIFLENSSAVTTRGGIQIIKSFTSLGYNCRWITKTAREEGAPHIRKRWFMLAYTDSKSSKQADQISESVENKERTRLRSSRQNRGDTSRTYWQAHQSPVLGMDDVVSFRMDRAKALGNSICVEQARQAFKELIGLD